MTVLTSCVDDEVSPEVDNLRQAQVNFLDAQAEFERARAANETAQAALQQANADNVAALLVQNVAEAEQAAAAAELRLQQSLNTLAGLANQEAQIALNNYNNTISGVNGVNDTRDELNKAEIDLTGYNNFLDVDGNFTDPEGATAIVENQIVEKEAEIAATEEAIVRLEGLNQDVASVENELESLENEIQTLQRERDQKRFELARFFEETYDDILAAKNELDNNPSAQRETEIFNEFGVANRNEFDTLFEEAKTNKETLEDEITAFQPQINELNDLVIVLGDYLNDLGSGTPRSIQTMIDNLENELDGSNPGSLQSDLEDLLVNLADRKVSAQELDDLINATQQEIESLTARLEAQQALAESYLDGFYAAIEEGGAVE